MKALAAILLLTLAEAQEAKPRKIVLIAGDPTDPTTYFNGYDRSEVSPISCPDNVAFDNDGNMWIATDGNALGACDGMYLFPLSGPHRGHLQQFLSVPAYSECCGPLVTWDQKTVLAAVRLLDSRRS